MRFILEKTFSFNKESENCTLSNIKYADKNKKIVYFLDIEKN